MKKNELVHLHALLSSVSAEYVERGVADAELFEPYRALGVTPMSMQVPRARHEEAVLTLARLLAGVDSSDDSAVERTESSPSSPSPSS